MNFAVSRINAKSEENDYYLELDVHSELYQMRPREKYRMLISNTLHMDGSAVTGYFPEVQVISARITSFQLDNLFKFFRILVLVGLCDLNIACRGILF